MMGKYVIARNGKYLSHLFEDDLDLMFRAERINTQTCYMYTIKQIAEDIARQLDAKVITITED